MLMSIHNPESVSKATDIIRNGGVIVYPTDTIYGLGGDACRENVIERIYRIKKRREFMPVSVIGHDIRQMRFHARLNRSAEKIMQHFMPGKITLICEANNKICADRVYSEGRYIGLRMPKHDFALAITRAADVPVVTTSVNHHGLPSLNDIDKIRSEFESSADCIFYDENYRASDASTVIKIDHNGIMTCLREGAVPYQRLKDLAILSK